jgi:hypothetical protein
MIEVGMHPAEYLVSDIYFEMQFLYYYLVEKIVSQKTLNFAGTVLTIKKYVTRKLQESRLKSKLYLFNCFSILRIAPPIYAFISLLINILQSHTV